MCGRYTLAGKPVDLEKQLRANLLHGTSLNQSWNIAPGSFVAAVLCERADTIVPVKWGLTPNWSIKSGKPLFLVNLRDDSIKTKPGFKHYLKNRRCIIPASGFYEWKADGKSKQPYYFHCLNQEFMFFAGIYEPASNDDSQNPMVSILTTEANALVNPIHNRMPVILHPEQARKWLESDDQNTLTDMLRPYPSDEMECWPVSTRVNKASTDDSALVDPITNLSNNQPTLF
jgi:putative SOS response-associated peptidase YedK